MSETTAKQGAQNIEYLHRLLEDKQPAFSAALELAADLVDLELTLAQLAAEPATRETS